MTTLGRFGPALTSVTLFIVTPVLLFLSATIVRGMLEQGGRIWFALPLVVVLYAPVLWESLLAFYQWVVRRGPKLWIEGDSLVYIHPWARSFPAGDIVGVEPWIIYSGWLRMPFYQLKLKQGQFKLLPSAGFKEGEREVLRRLQALAAVNRARAAQTSQSPDGR